MQTHSRLIPSLAATVLLLAGIAAGRAVGASCVATVPCLRWLVHPVTLGTACAFLALSALLTAHRARISTVTVLAAVFILGVFLIRSSGRVSIWGGVNTVLQQRLGSDMSEKRRQLCDIYRCQGLKDDAYGVVAAMTLGERQGVSTRLKEAYRTSGAAHVFALSGLYLGIIYLFLALILPRWRHPRASSAVLLPLLWAYTVLVGCHPSVCRAAVMLTLYTLLTLLARRSGGMGVLLFTAFLLLAVMPEWLADAGFLMSFMAVLCISVFYKLLYRRERFYPWRDPYYRISISNPAKPFDSHSLKFYRVTALRAVSGWVWSMVSVSLSAQLLVAPLVAYYFGTVSPWFLLANLIVSPLALLIIPLAFVVLLLGLLVPFLPIVQPFLHLVVTALDVVVRTLNNAILWVASLPGV